jgi:hypothetical protein
MAAHVEGKGAIVLDMSGLAQKGGPVMSHVRLADRQADLHSTRVGTGSADLVIGCDLIVTASRDALSRMGEGRTYAAINSTGSSTAAFVKNPDWQFPAPRRKAARDRQGLRREQHRLRRRRPDRHRADGRLDRDQHVHARLRMAKRPGAIDRSVDHEGDRAEQRVGRLQQERLQLGPHRRARPGVGDEDDHAGQGHRVQAHPDPGRHHRQAHRTADRLPGRRLRAAIQGLRRAGARRGSSSWARARA